MTLISDLRDRIRVLRGEAAAEDAYTGSAGAAPLDTRADSPEAPRAPGGRADSAEDTHRGMAAIDDTDFPLDDEPMLEPGDAARLARSSVAVEPKNEKQRREAARALGRLLSGLEDHQRHQTKVLRYLEPIPDLSQTATELRRDAARLLEAAGDSREHARTVERRVEAGIEALGERHAAIEQSVARLKHDVEATLGAVRELGASSEHVRAGLGMVHERTERLSEGLTRMIRLVEDGETAMRARLERQTRLLIAVGAGLAIVGLVGLFV